LSSPARDLIVAISHANSGTIQSTRINQEMRTLASVIGEEISAAAARSDRLRRQGGASNGMSIYRYSQTNTTAGDCLITVTDTTLNKGLG
jgi:hypothetical protein